jgi:hypothetical protein
MRALAPEVRFALHVLKSVPQRLKAVERQTIFGTAEAVPFVQRGFSLSLYIRMQQV